MRETILLEKRETTLAEALKLDEDVPFAVSRVQALRDFEEQLWQRRSSITALVRHHLGLGLGTDGDKDACRVLPQAQWRRGRFNVCVFVSVSVAAGAAKQIVVFRCPKPHELFSHGTPSGVAEKMASEVANYAWIDEHCPDLRIPHLFGFGLDGQRHYTHVRQLSGLTRSYNQTWRSIHRQLQRPLVSKFVENTPAAGALLDVASAFPYTYMILEFIGLETGQMLSNTFTAHSDPAKMARLSRSIGRAMLALARVPLPRIGSLSFCTDGTISLAGRPVTAAVAIAENENDHEMARRRESQSESQSGSPNENNNQNENQNENQNGSQNEDPNGTGIRTMARRMPEPTSERESEQAPGRKSEQGTNKGPDEDQNKDQNEDQSKSQNKHAQTAAIPLGAVYDNTDSFVSDMLTFHDQRLVQQPYAVRDDSDCRFQMAVLAVLRILAPRYVRPEHRGGPFVLQFTDLHASNILVDDDWNITCIIDLEWMCALPREMLAVPYWLTGCTIDIIIDDEYDRFNKVRHAFLQILKEEAEEEEQKRGKDKRVSVDSGRELHHLLSKMMSDEEENVVSSFWISDADAFVGRKMKERKAYEERIRALFADE
ncbi:hypothetical protein SCUCBS95973_007945 [Sporothrix curviconia]|uniref:Aminoglycoside phosphotransferase domain-containing protein n=1 Tax=Sporothrix curviconia TaxID=1260050 RepID=A0ABP0CI48_9PEZI